MIVRATISHFKSIAEANIEFQPLNVIVGPNGVGKSNIIDAMCFLRDCCDDDLDTAVVKRHGIESIRQWSRTRPYHITIEVEVKDNRGRGKYRVTLSSGRGSYRVYEEYGEWNGPLPFTTGEEKNTVVHSWFFRESDGTIRVSSDHEDPRFEMSNKPIQLPTTELFLTYLAGPIASLGLYIFRSIAECIKGFSAYSIYPNTLREPRVVSRQEHLAQDGANLASIMKTLNSGHRRNKESIIDSLRVILPQIADISVKSAGGYYVPVLHVEEANGDIHQFNMSQLSDGTLRILGLLTAFYQPNAPDVIALEEPEQMLHPGALPIILDAAKEFVSSKNRQVFMTTHSPSLLDLVTPESIIWTNFRDGLTVCGPVNYRQLSMIKEQLFSPGEIFLSEGFIDQ